ncbi:MAG: presqualene diphosphate synthase HpnD [Rhodospirillales bacterium]
MILGGALALAVVSALAWLFLILFRGSFWKADQRLEDVSREREHWPAVVAVIPARDEEGSIGRTVSSLLRQDYPGSFHVIVVDDNSSDGTAAEARHAAEASPERADCLTVLDGVPLSPGWTGKLWAVHQGVRHAEHADPSAAYVLLTDADIEHGPQSLRRLVDHAERGGYDLVSLMVLLQCRSFWERWLIPAFVFFFQKLYPFSWVNDPKRATAAAAGGCMLVRRAALDRIGGIQAIGDRLIDDCALAAAIKKGGRIWLGLTKDTISLRRYDSLSDIWGMVARSAFEQLKHSAVLLLMTVIAMAVIYLMPPLAVIAGIGAADPVLTAVGLAAYAGMAAAYRPTLRLYGMNWGWAAGLPGAGLLYVLMTLDSARRHWRGKGGAWKGRYHGSGLEAVALSGEAMGFMTTATLSPDVAEAHAHVEAIVKQSKTSFFWAMRRLGEDKRRAMYAVYAFCRDVDDIADDPGLQSNKIVQLDAWREEIERLYAGAPLRFIGQALLAPLHRYGLRKKDFMALIDGMEMDAHDKVRIPDKATLELYCDRVACAVGRLSNRIFGIDEDTGDRVAYALGQALQLTNILRDVYEDAQRNRLYLPESLLHDYRVDVPNDARMLLSHPLLPTVCRVLAQDAARRFGEAEKILATCDRAQMRPAIMMMESYRRIFRKLQNAGWQRLDSPVSLSKAEKLWVLLRHGIL